MKVYSRGFHDEKILSWKPFDFVFAIFSTLLLRKMCEDLPFGEINRNLASKLCLKNNI